MVKGKILGGGGGRRGLKPPISPPPPPRNYGPDKGIFIKDNLKYEICKLENDTTEHLLKCTSNESIQYNVGRYVHVGNFR